MSGGEPRPPALSARLLRWAADRLGTPELHHDADELFAERVRADGAGAARRWYRRQAFAALGRLSVPGGAARARAGGRRGGWVAGLSGLSLDAKLGARMLGKHPWVSFAGGLALTIGIGLAAAYLEGVNDFLRPTLPLPDGDRIVGIRTWDRERNAPELRSIHDFLAWRDELRTVEELSAFQSIERNLAVGSGPAEPAAGALMTPSGFRVVRVPALLGRTLVEGDGNPAEPPVIVLGYDLWEARFSGDPGIVGRTVRLGSATATVVGVMPEGFGFPVSHDFWAALDPEAMSAYEPREGPPIQIFGRLAPGADMEQARAELAGLGARAARDLPATHAQLSPEVMPYTGLFIDAGGSQERFLIQLLFVVVLLLLSANVATLLFARMATRQDEVAVRLALGAGRARIVGQLFVEALVLALGAAGVALVLVAAGTGWATRMFWSAAEGRVPFWLDDRLNPETVAAALGLALLAATVAGALPALRAIGPNLQARLRDAATGGARGAGSGGLWTGLIVTQMALTVFALPTAILFALAMAQPAMDDPGFDGERYVTARLARDAERPPAGPQADSAYYTAFEETVRELGRRLLADPEVERVTLADRLPGMNHPLLTVEIDSAGGTPPPPADPWAMAAAVEPDFFETFGAEVVAGRGLLAGDAVPGSEAVVVNRSFVERVLQGRNAVGRRVRYLSRYGARSATGEPRGGSVSFMREPGPWYEIVGVVSDLGMDTKEFAGGPGPGIYHLLRPAALGSDGAYAIRMAARVRGEGAAFAPEVRRAAAALDPDLRLYDVLPLTGPVDRTGRAAAEVFRFFGAMGGIFVVITLLVSTAGTYSLMSFSVSRRTREIGIRTALGADRGRIVRAVFSRAMGQVGTGLLVGTLLWVWVVFGVLDVDADRRELALSLAAWALLPLVSLLACAVPVRRALKIEPTEALRELG